MEYRIGSSGGGFRPGCVLGALNVCPGCVLGGHCVCPKVCPKVCPRCVLGVS